MKNFRVLAVVLAALMIMGSLTVTAGAFNDLTYESDPVMYKKTLLISEMGVMRGDNLGNANLDKFVTRAEMAAFIFRLGTTYTDIIGGMNTTTFKDIPEDAWYTSNVVWCVDQGIIVGRSATVYDPSADVSYDEAIKMVCCLLGYKNLPYPLGYQLKLYDLLKARDMKMNDLLPKYKGDTAGKRNPISRGEVVILLDFALNAPMGDANGKPTTKTLMTEVWKSAAIIENKHVVVGTSSASIGGAAKASAAGKLVVASYNDETKAVDYASAFELDAAEYGLPTDKDLLGANFSYYTMQKENKQNILTDLTAYGEPTFYTDAEVRAYKTNNVKYVRVQDTEFKSSDTAASSVVFTSKDSVPTFSQASADLEAVYTDIDNGKEIHACALDLFSDGTIDFVSFGTLDLGFMGGLAKFKASNDTQTIRSLKSGSVNSIDLKRSELSADAYAQTVASFDADGNTAGFLAALSDNKCGAVQGDVVAYYALGNRLVITEKLNVISGTITKVEKVSISSTMMDAYTIKGADGSRDDYTVAVNDGKNNRFSNADWLNPAISSQLVATTARNFIVYGYKIVGVFADDDIVPVPTYSRTDVALFYGLSSRDVTFEMSFEWDPDAENFKAVYTPSFRYFALVAYQKDPSKIVKVAVKEDGTGIFVKDAAAEATAGTVKPLREYYPETITGAFSSTTRQAPKDVSVTAKINGLATDGSSVVIVTVNKDKNDNITDYTICKAFAPQTLSGAAGDQEKIIGKYGLKITQSAFTGAYQLGYTKDSENNDDVGLYSANVQTDSASVMIELVPLTLDGKKNIVDPTSGKLAKYTAKKLTSLGSIVKNEAYAVLPDSFLYSTTDNKKTEVIVKEADGKVTVRTLVVTKDTSAAAPQIIGTAADLTKDPYLLMILKSIDSFTVENRSATASFTLYNPATATTISNTLTVTGASDSAALANLQTAVNEQLVPYVGQFISYNSSTKKWSGQTLEAWAAAHALTCVPSTDNKNLILSGIAAGSTDFAPSALDADNTAFTLTVTRDNGGTPVSEPLYLKLSNTVNIFSFGSFTDKDTYFKAVAIDQIPLRVTSGGKTSYNTKLTSLGGKTINFFLDAAGTVVFAYVG